MINSTYKHFSRPTTWCANVIPLRKPTSLKKLWALNQVQEKIIRWILLALGTLNFDFFHLKFSFFFFYGILLAQNLWNLKNYTRTQFGNGSGQRRQVEPNSTWQHRRTRPLNTGYGNSQTKLILNYFKRGSTLNLNGFSVRIFFYIRY